MGGLKDELKRDSKAKNNHQLKPKDELKYSKFWWGEDPSKSGGLLIFVGILGIVAANAQLLPNLNLLLEKLSASFWLLYGISMLMFLWMINKGIKLRGIAKKIEEAKEQEKEEERKKKEEEKKKKEEAKEEQRKKKEEEKAKKAEEVKQKKEEKRNKLVEKYGKKFGSAIFSKKILKGMNSEMVIDSIGKPKYKDSDKWYYGKPFNRILVFEEEKILSDKKLNKSIWIDMSKDMLVASWGRPENKKEDISKDKIKLRWYFGERISRQNTTVYKYEVRIENDVVVGWKEL